MQESPKILRSMAREVVRGLAMWSNAYSYLNRGTVIREATVWKAASFSYQPPSIFLRILPDIDPKVAKDPDVLAYAVSRKFADIAQHILDGGLDADTTVPTPDS